MNTWHLDNPALLAYADGSLDDPRAYSIEAHLTTCAECRARVANAFDGTRIDELWSAIVAEVDAPRPTPMERLLLRAGVSEHDARLLAATPSLSAAWIGAVALALAFAVLAAHLVATDRALLAFLGVAPLVPIVGVAAAYGPGIDPSYEITVAAPMHGWRLLALRASAVLTVSIALAALAASALPAVGWVAAAWLLPALCGTLLTMALASYVGPRLACGGVAWVWLAIVATTARLADAPLDLFGAPTQIASAAVGAVALAVTLSRRGAFDTTR
ncbi:MAG: zf-HC2 domain-containing protein [Nitriliruptorales bacterium]|nr:zf-HC2 domain-containing protein [Nitriliruptorales bacterium]